jgi:hypothetical protein
VDGLDIEIEAKEEIDRVGQILKELKLTKTEGQKILELIKSYFIDAKHFYKEGKFLQAFEAAVICWAYMDAGLHLGVFEVPANLLKHFTV